MNVVDPVHGFADVCADNPLVLLFVLVGLGSAIGAVRFRSFSLGPAAVLFVALAFSAYDERLKLPVVIGQLGLVLFAYTIGVAAGPSFFATVRSGGRSVALVVGPARARGGHDARCRAPPRSERSGAVRGVRGVADQHPCPRREHRAARLGRAHRRLLRHLPVRRPGHAARGRRQPAHHGAYVGRPRRPATAVRAGSCGRQRRGAAARPTHPARGRRGAPDAGRAGCALRPQGRVLPGDAWRRPGPPRAVSTWPPTT